MKLKEVFYLVGLKPKPKTYGFEINRFELPSDGSVAYAQWLHPKEGGKVISQADVDELRKFLAPGDVAVDIGAHAGDTAIPIALAVGKTGAVFALEPNRFVFEVLEKNAELNREKTNIIPLKFAATETDGEFEFNYSDAGFCNGGWHSGLPAWRHAHNFKLKVEGKNLSNFLLTNYPEAIEKIRFIKVDAEGYDFSVLKSLETLIAAQKPYIKAEVYKLSKFSERRAFFGFLKNLGYEIYKLESEANYRGELLETAEAMGRWRHFDIFCAPAK